MNREKEWHRNQVREERERMSKVWLSLLSNPNFITKWLEINIKSLPWIHYHSDTPHCRSGYPFNFGNAYPDSHSTLLSRNEYGFSFEFLANEKGGELFLLGSSNGLVLSFSNKLDGGGSGGGSYHVCNPLTQKSVTIPSPPCRHADQYAYNGIICENPLSACCRYKVVCISKFKSSKKFNVDMFDSDLGEWRSIEVSCDQDVSSGYGYRWGAVTLNGVIYFLEDDNRMFVYNLNQKNISNNGNLCSLIDLPGRRFFDVEMLDDGPYGRGIFHNRIIGESEGWICYARSRGTDNKQIFVSVWVLDEENWQVLHEDILVPSTLTDFFLRTCPTDIHVSGFSPLNRNIVLLRGQHRVWWYDIQTKCFEELDRSSLLANKYTGGTQMCQPFVLKTIPTILPMPVLDR